MKRFSEQFKKQADSISLKASERADLRERVVAYMEYHPLPQNMRTEKSAAVAGVRGILSQPFVSLPINWFFVRGSAAAFVLLVAITVPVAAEYTAPGDVLYPVKVRFNEEVRSSLTLSPYEKIEWETERLERRISEARLLASEGKLTDEVEAEVAIAVKAHSDSAKAQIASLRETNEDEAAIAEIAFATALSVQSEVLDNTVAAAHADAVTSGAAGEDSDTAGSVLATLVAEETTAAEASQAASAPSYDALMARVELETTAAYELFASVKTQASPEQVADIERRLSDIERKVAEATTPQDSVPAASEPAVAEEVLVVTEEALPVADGTTSEMTATEIGTTTPEAVPALTASEATESAEVVALAPEVVPAPEVALTEAESIEILRGAMVDLRKLITFMTDLDVRSSVTVDDLVPITLTDDERMQAVAANLEVMRAFGERTAGESYTGAGSDKINFEIAEVARLLTEAEAAAAVPALDSAEALGTQGVALIGDIESMIQFFGAQSAAPAETATTTPVE